MQNLIISNGKNSSGEPVRRYVKGARSERELLDKFYQLGYSVMRAAGSGVNALGPDIIALKGDVCFAIECKAWDRGSLSLEPDQYMKLIEWERNNTSKTFVAWRISHKGWYFIKLDEFTKGKANYNVTFKKVEEINRLFESILPKTDTGPVAAPQVPAVKTEMEPRGTGA